MFDHAQEELEYEFNARYDYVREAYGDMVEDEATLLAEAEACYAEWLAEQEAFIGPRLPAPVYEDDIPF
jgi:hypothetical protein